MSKRNDRRAAEREARQLAYRQLRQQQAQQSTLSEQAPVQTAETETVTDLLSRAHAFFETAPPPKPLSDAQLAANRANAQLSTGAVTPEGKARSSRNALKHGLTGKTVLLPHEDEDEYQHQLDILIQIHKPGTGEEIALVQSLRDSEWRLNRIHRLETAILLKGHLEFAGKYADRTPLERAHLIEAEAYLKYEKQIRNLYLQEARIRRTMDKERIEFARLYATRRRQELVEIQSQTKIKKAESPANGFEFSTQTNCEPATPEHNHLMHQRAA